MSVQVQSGPEAVGRRFGGKHGGCLRCERRAESEPAGLLQRHPCFHPAARLLCRQPSHTGTHVRWTRAVFTQCTHRKRTGIHTHTRVDSR